MPTILLVINPPWIFRSSYALRHKQKQAFPKIIPHSDGSGIIEAVGSNVNKNRVGRLLY